MHASLKRLADLPQWAKSLLIMAADVIVLPFALFSALALRLGEFPLVDSPPPWVYGLAVAITVPVFLKLGLYRAVIRYFETRAFTLVITAAGVAAAIFSALILALGVHEIPRSSLVIYAVLSAAYAALARLIARQVMRSTVKRERVAEPVAIYGAGDAGQQLARALRTGLEFRPVLFVDDNPVLHGRSVMGLRVYSADALGSLVGKNVVETVIVAIPSLSPGRRAELLRRLEAFGVEVRLVPGMADLARNNLRVSDLRDVRPEDLLGRDAIQLDGKALHVFLEGRTVMVTGAGGSIGSELCRQIARYAPRELVLFEANELALYTLREEFTALFPALPVVCAMGDVKNGLRIASLLERHRPAVIFHAAAYKHVPLTEEVNAWEAVRNNTLGTTVVAEAAIRYGVEKFVLVSTDKAVNPTNVMGASKRLAEMACQTLHQQGVTRFEIVRFGNVLGSSGSVIPKFRDQIAAGGPVTVTHPEIVRYFMSIPEAAQLVLQAACMGRGGEVFVLDMGEPVRILDLARNMIRLSGRTEEEIGIEFTGLRPGEKLFEELLADDELTRPTHHPKIRIARVGDVEPRIWLALRSWIYENVTYSDELVRCRMSELLGEYRPWSGKERREAARVVPSEGYAV